MTAEEHLRWCADRALEYFDGSDKTSAIASFLSDVGKHDGTRHIQGPLAMMMLPMEYDNGRDAFERFMMGFAVVNT
jgi:hypothetical protein